MLTWFKDGVYPKQHDTTSGYLISFIGIIRTELHNNFWHFSNVRFCKIFLEMNIFLNISKFLTNISIFDQNFDFWPNFRFLTKISIFDQNFDFWPKFRFWIKLSIFDRIFDFWPRFRFLTRICIFDHDLHFFWF